MASQYIPVRSGTGYMIGRSNAASVQIDSGDGYQPKFVQDSTVTTLARRVTKLVTADTTLTAADNGSVVLINATTNTNITLPATAIGLRFTIGILQSAGGGALHKITPNASDKIMGGGLTAADAKYVGNTQATAAVGDCLELVADGVDGWLIVIKTGTWARES